jgi:hypothetical protein
MADMAETPRQRRRGPDPKPREEQRLHPVSCRLTDAELALLDERRGKISRGEWLRRAALAQPPRIVPEINKQAWSELSRTASNLNQMTRALNEGGWKPADELEAKRALQLLWGQLKTVRAQLIGLEEEKP